MEIIEGIPEAVADHRVDQLRMAHAQPGAGLGQHVGRQAHVFLTASDDHFGVAAANRLRRQVQRLETGAADLVQRERWHRVGKARLDRSLARGVLAGAGGEDLPEDDFIDFGGIQPGLFQ